MADLKHTPCDCAEWRRLNEACSDLLAERDALRDQVKDLIQERNQALDSLRARDSLMVAFKEEAERERDEAQSDLDDSLSEIELLENQLQERCIQFAELQAERNEWKRRAKMMHEWMQQRQYYHHAAPWLLFMQDHLPHAPDGWFNNA